jgi:hypothetical protein
MRLFVKRISNKENLTSKYMKKHAWVPGVVVGVSLFFVFYEGLFGMPPMDLVGSVGAAFGSGLGISVCMYLTSRDED